MKFNLKNFNYGEFFSTVIQSYGDKKSSYKVVKIKNKNSENMTKELSKIEFFDRFSIYKIEQNNTNDKDMNEEENKEERGDSCTTVRNVM